MDQFEYRPFCVEKWIFRVFLPINIGEFILAGYWISRIGMVKPVFFFLLMALSTFGMNVFLLRSSFATLSFDSEHIMITEGWNHSILKYRWIELPYCYRDRNYKNFVYLVCSPNELDKKEVRRYIRRASSRSKICLDSAVVIPINDLQKISKKVEDIVLNNGKVS